MKWAYSPSPYSWGQHLPSVKDYEQEVLLTQQRACCQLSINNKQFIYNILFLWDGRWISHFAHNFKNRANETYLFHCYSVYLFKKHKLTVCCDLFYGTFNHTWRPDWNCKKKLLALFSSKNTGLRVYIRVEGKYESKKCIKKIKFAFAIYAVKAEVIVGCFFTFIPSFSLLPFTWPHSFFIIQCFSDRGDGSSVLS